MPVQDELPNYRLMNEVIDMVHPVLARFIYDSLVREYGTEWWSKARANLNPDMVERLGIPEAIESFEDMPLDFSLCLHLLRKKDLRGAWTVDGSSLPWDYYKNIENALDVRNISSHRMLTDLKPGAVMVNLNILSDLCRPLDPVIAAEIDRIQNGFREGHYPSDPIPDMGKISESGTVIVKDGSEYVSKLRGTPPSGPMRPSGVPSLTEEQSGTLAEACVLSCDNISSYLKRNGEGGSKILSGKYELMEDDSVVVISLPERLYDGNTDGLELYIDNERISPDHYSIDEYDDNVKAVTVTLDRLVMEKLTAPGNGKKPPKLNLRSNMLWLIDSLGEFFKSYGSRIHYPDNAPVFEPSEYDFRSQMVLSEEQTEAVRTVLNNPLSYVWGVPGSGKTQCVLATSIMAYMKRNEKVLVVAPTNNALEQVLTGLINALPELDPDHRYIDINRDVLRMGTPSETFLKKYGACCEARGIKKKIDTEMGRRNHLIEALFFRQSEPHLRSVTEIRKIIDGAGKDGFTAETYSRIEELYAPVRDFLGGVPDRCIPSYDVRELPEFIDRIERALTTPSDVKLNYKGKSEKELEGLLDGSNEKIAKMLEMKTEARMLSSKVIAVTAASFVIRNELSPETGGLTGLDIRHIFLDEAGYTSVARALPLFVEGIPVTFLGDDKQLQPVCSVGPEILIPGAMCTIPDPIIGGPFEWGCRYCFMHEQPSLFIEDYLRGDLSAASEAYCGKGSEPGYDIMRRADLLLSRRFDDNLAKLLDVCIYHKGISGMSSDPMQFIPVDAGRQPEELDVRYNPKEVELIWERLPEWKKLGTYVIMTPYTVQLSNLKKAMPEEEDNIMTVHRSQGREWDTVILSVSDSKNTIRDVKYRLQALWTFPDCMSSTRRCPAPRRD